MKKTMLAGLGLLGLALLPAAAASAQTGTSWLHVRVEEAKDKTKVAVNLPMTVVEAALKAAPGIIEEHGKVNLTQHHKLPMADVRKAWKELAAAGDAELVTVESPEENVKVQRKGDLIQVFVDKKGKTAQETREEVRVEVPVSLVDAALSGEGDTVDVQAVVAQMMKMKGDIVRVKAEDANVRVWIDDQNVSSGAAPR